MTKSELKQIIKGIIVESINERKKLKEQDEMPPINPGAEAEPDAGAVEGPETQETPTSEHQNLLTQIDSIIDSLNALKGNLQTHAGVSDETEEAPEGEEGEMEDSEGEEPV